MQGFVSASPPRRCWWLIRAHMQLLCLYMLVAQELLVLDRLLYRNRSQHRSAKYFTLILEVCRCTYDLGDVLQPAAGHAHGEKHEHISAAREPCP